MSFINDIKIFYKFKNVLYICIVNRMRFVGVSFDVETYFSRKKSLPKFAFWSQLIVPFFSRSLK